MKDEMKAYDRVMAVFDGQPTDRVAVISPTSVANIENMKATGAGFPEVHTNSDKMAALAAAGHDIIGFDTVMPYFSVQQESAALGCTVNWGLFSSMPTISSNPYQEPDDFQMPKDFLDRLPIKTVLEAIRLLKHKYGADVAVIGKVMGPWTLAYHLHGVQDFLIETMLEPEKVTAFLQVFKEISLTFALAQVEAGADLLTWADHATGDLVGAGTYESFLLPVHCACMAEFKRRSPRRVPVILHTCGNTFDRVGLFAQAGFDAFHFDSRNDPARMLAAVKTPMLLAGGVNNPEVLLHGTSDDVRNQVNSIIDAGIRLVAPECAIPTAVKTSNLQAIVEAARNRG